MALTIELTPIKCSVCGELIWASLDSLGIEIRTVTCKIHESPPERFSSIVNEKNKPAEQLATQNGEPCSSISSPSESSSSSSASSPTPASSDGSSTSASDSPSSSSSGGAKSIGSSDLDKWAYGSGLGTLAGEEDL